MKREDRARQTFKDVMLPILQAEVPQLRDAPDIQGYALEISHHVRKKMLGVSTEHAENVVLVIPKSAALRLLAARDEAAQEAALDEASLFVNGESASLWTARDADPPPEPAPVVKATVAPPAPDSLKTLQTTYQETLDKLVRELNTTAHFVSYAPPVFVNFHNGVYLQLSFTTTIQSPEAASRYRAAALAFDDHVAHLIRPVLAYFKDAPKFAGIDFSTTVKPAGQAVEYIFDVTNLHCYEQYDCTGQQLINAGYVLINGERVNLELQGAER
jgi:hypothetical protein